MYYVRITKPPPLTTPGNYRIIITYTSNNIFSLGEDEENMLDVGVAGVDCTPSVLRQQNPFETTHESAFAASCLYYDGGGFKGMPISNGLEKKVYCGGGWFAGNGVIRFQEINIHIVPEEYTFAS